MIKKNKFLISEIEESKNEKVFLLIISISFLIVLNCHQAYAGRPLSTEDAAVAGKGVIEAELGFEYARQNNRDNNYALLLVPIYGLTECMQLSIESPFDIKDPKGDPTEAGLGDIILSLKTLLSPEKEIIPALALKMDLKFATGNEAKGLGSGDEDLRLILAATKTIGLLTLHGNIGYTFVGTKADNSLNNSLLYGVALEYPLTQKLTIVSEVYGEGNHQLDVEAFEEHTVNPLIGLTYQMHEKIILDAALKTGVCHEEKSEYGITGGMSISF